MKISPKFHTILRHISYKSQPYLKQILRLSQTNLGTSLDKSQNISGIFAYMFTILIFLYSLSSTNLYLFSCYFYMHLDSASMYDPRTCFQIKCDTSDTQILRRNIDFYAILHILGCLMHGF